MRIIGCDLHTRQQTLAMDNGYVHGELTLGENVADLGDESLAYMAWKSATKDKKLEPIDRLTPEQRFFIGFAQWDCANERPEDLRMRHNRSALSGAIPHRWRGGEHAGVRAGFFLQTRPADGQAGG